MIWPSCLSSRCRLQKVLCLLIPCTRSHAKKMYRPTDHRRSPDVTYLPVGLLAVDIPDKMNHWDRCKAHSLLAVHLYWHACVCARTSKSISTCSKESWQNYFRRNGKRLHDVGNSMLIHSDVRERLSRCSIACPNKKNCRPYGVQADLTELR